MDAISLHVLLDGATPEPAEQWTYNLAFTSMADFADAVHQAFNDAQPANG